MLGGASKGGIGMKKKIEETREPPKQQLDRLSSLPPEIVQYLTKFFHVRTVLQWRLVCRAWRDMLLSPAMSGFWRRASRHAGVPPDTIRRLQPQCDSVDAIFQQARLNTDHIARIRPHSKFLRGVYPFEGTSRCLYAGNGYFVRTLDAQSLEEEETVIGQLCPHKRTIQKVASVHVGKQGELQFAANFANHIVWMTNEGHWFKYDLENRTHSRLVDRAVKKADKGSIGFCRHCLFFMVTSSEMIMHAYYWKLQFFKVEGEEVIEAIHRPPMPSKITQYMPRPVKPHLISKDGCRSHRLVVQGGTGGSVFDVTHDSEARTIDITESLATLNPYYDLQIAVMVVTAISEIVLSPDEKFVALIASIVYPYNTGLCLYFFDLTTFERTLWMRIKWREGFDDCQLIAVSSLYAVISVGHSDGIVKVIHCHSGDIVSSFGPITSNRLPPVVYSSRLKHVSTLGVHGQECLSDIRGKFSIAVVYRKGTGNLEAVFYDPYPPSLALLEAGRRDSDSDNDVGNHTRR